LIDLLLPHGRETCCNQPINGVMEFALTHSLIKLMINVSHLWVAKYKSGGDRSLKQTAAMWPPRVTVKRGWNS
jgi:hypothetical protein